LCPPLGQFYSVTHAILGSALANASLELSVTAVPSRLYVIFALPRQQLNPCMGAVLLSINADVIDRLSVLINYGADLNRQRTVLNPVFLPFLVLVFKKHIAIINPPISSLFC
jgi:hypothetical protein